jgi:hypothetical protein
MLMYGKYLRFLAWDASWGRLVPQLRLFCPAFAEPKIMQNNFMGLVFPLYSGHCHYPQKPLVEAAIIRLVSDD